MQLRLTLNLLALAMAVALVSGCEKKKCKTDEDCREGGKHPDRICYNGQCVSLKGEGGAAPGPAPGRRQEVDPTATFKVPVDPKNHPIKGPVNAPVTVVEFSDYQCFFCNRAAQTMDELVKAFPKAVRVVFMHNPLERHKEAQVAARASQAVFALKGNEAFWKYHDKIFANRENLNRANLDTWAKELGVDMAKFKDALDKDTYDKLVKDQQALAAKLGVTGSPAFFINGRFVSGAQPLEVFKTKVNEALEAAQKVLGEGKVQPKGLYDHIMKDAKDSAVYK